MLYLMSCFCVCVYVTLTFALYIFFAPDIVLDNH